MASATVNGQPTTWLPPDLQALTERTAVDHVRIRLTDKEWMGLALLPQRDRLPQDPDALMDALRPHADRLQAAARAAGIPVTSLGFGTDDPQAGYAQPYMRVSIKRSDLERAAPQSDAARWLLDAGKKEPLSFIG